MPRRTEKCDGHEPKLENRHNMGCFILRSWHKGEGQKHVMNHSSIQWPAPSICYRFQKTKEKQTDRNPVLEELASRYQRNLPQKRLAISTKSSASDRGRDILGIVVPSVEKHGVIRMKWLPQRKGLQRKRTVEALVCLNSESDLRTASHFNIHSLHKSLSSS